MMLLTNFLVTEFITGNQNKIFAYKMLNFPNHRAKVRHFPSHVPFTCILLKIILTFSLLKPLKKAKVKDIICK